MNSGVLCTHRDVFFFSAAEPEKSKQMLTKFHDFQRKAEMYYVYHSIQRYTVSALFECSSFNAMDRMLWVQDEPFTSHLPEALFNMSRYLLHCISGDIPMGISKVYVLSNHAMCIYIQTNAF